MPQEYVSKVQLLNVGDIVIAASSGSRHVVGKAAALTVPWFGSFGAFCYGLRPHLQGTANYISLFLQTSMYRDHVSALSAGININNLRRQHIERVPLPVAPLNEQHRIVAKIEELFSELDKGVESLKTARAQLKVYRQAVLKHAFEGKLTARWRGENKDKLETPEQLIAHIKQERGAHYEQRLKEGKRAVKRWKERGIGDSMDEPDSARSGIPPSWIVKKLEVLSRKITKGATPTTYGYEFQDSGINFVRIENISNGLIELSTIQTFISEEAHENQGRSILEENDILFSIAGTIGQTCIVRKKDLPANTNQALAIVSGYTDCLVPKFLEFQLRSTVASGL